MAGPLVLVQSTMNARQCMAVLEEHLLPFARSWVVSLQDNSPVHKSNDESHGSMGRPADLSNGGKAHLPGWFALNHVSLIKAPSMSPDLNVIENLWAYVKTKLRGKDFHTKFELWFYMRKVWSSIRPAILHKLVDSMPKRLNEVILARGGPIEY